VCRAHGHEVYGPKYAETIRDSIRRATEQCDSLQVSFFKNEKITDKQDKYEEEEEEEEEEKEKEKEKKKKKK